MVNLILCGGSGTRLWPISRTLMPKQFYPLFDGNSLFEETVKRNQKFCSEFWTASNRDQIFLAFEQMAGLGIKSEKGLIEPVGRNTAPAIALVCFALSPETLILVTPSDHLITNEKAYQEAVTKATVLAGSGNLVTFGIKPAYPETGFGYIEAQGEKVLSFREKPDQKTAQSYIDKGNYYWNSGMFLFKAGVFLEELRSCAPDVFKTCEKAYLNAKDTMPLAISFEDMKNIPNISIDYAVMEKSKKVTVVPCDLGWSDLGSFDSLYEETYNKMTKNAIISRQAPIVLDSQNNLLVSEDRKIALVDVNDLLIIDSPDALLIAKKGSSQKVKEVVAELKNEKSSLLDAPSTVKKPWGSYTVLQDQPNFKVKRLDVLPGKRLSLQKHGHRQEHWVIAQGTARVQVGDEVKVLVRNQYVYIPLGEKHRLENAGQENLTVVETQIGDYFGEDDIVRLEDDFARK